MAMSPGDHCQYRPGDLDKVFSLNPNQSFGDFKKEFSALKGIGEWTVNYVAMRGQGMVDSFPATDLGIIKALEKNGKRLGRKEILKMAEKWRPYRAYASGTSKGTSYVLHKIQHPVLRDHPGRG